MPSGELALEPPPVIAQSSGARWQQYLMVLPMLAGTAATAMMFGGREGASPYTYVVGAIFGISTLGMLVNGERAVLQFRPADGAALWCSDNPGYLGAPAATYPFLCSDAELVQLPTAWSVPAALAQRALQQFEANGERPMAIAWQSCAPSAGGSDGGAASWELLPQPTAAR